MEDLAGEQAWSKLKELAEKAESCFFLTNIKTGLPSNSRPMSPQKIDDDGTLWFLSANDSRKNADIAKDPMVQMFFQASAHSGFLDVYGIAEITEDKAIIDELWDPLLKVWFTEGKDDPRISVIKVSPTQGYYWDNKHGNAIAFVKMVAGAIIGQTFDDSIEGKLID
ncbi:pyridoxamine 5'-phosphate oxidase family protein [Mucilaginibacter myungsuensis]|nr:pyridoxamine 5'-phosphate oxidase family protein [Mucilaginibacter myungsuensis]